MEIQVPVYSSKNPVTIIHREEKVRSTGLEPVPVAGHAPQTCAYADSATTAEQSNYRFPNAFCQALTEVKIPVNLKTSAGGECSAMRKIWKIVIPIAVVIFLFQRSSNAFSERQLSVSINGQIVCYRENTFQVNAPESGHLTITVNTDDTVYQIIEADVETGKNSIKWDGLGFNEEKLYPMNYHIDADLNGNSGIKYQFRFDSQIINSAQAMTLALPSSEKLYLDNREEWFLECKVIRSGMLLIEMIPEGASEPAYTFRKNVEPLRIIHLTFDDIAGKTQISPGRYTMRVFEMSNTAYMKEFIITAESIMPDMPPVSVTGQIMPEEENDEEIWNMMMEPAVVINIGSMNHQNVYESPDEKSASLGTLHGQTQALCVIRIWNDWALVEAWNHEEAEKVTGWIPLGKLKVVYPNRDYGLLVSKKDQTVAVFYRGKRLDTIRVCTGKMEKNRLYQETAAGSFLTGEHRVDYSTNGNKYDFVIQYDGGNLIHQIPYRFGEGKKDFTEGKALLGTKASHACIRIQSDPGKQSGINAYWIWTHIPYHTRVIILDDADERHAEKEKIYGINNQKMKDESGETPSGEIKGNADTGREPEKSLKNAGNDTVLMTFGGDAVLGGREWYYYRDDSLPAYVEKYGMSYPFSVLQEYFASDDLKADQSLGAEETVPQLLKSKGT